MVIIKMVMAFSKLWKISVALGLSYHASVFHNFETLLFVLKPIFLRDCAMNNNHQLPACIRSNEFIIVSQIKHVEL